MMSRRRKPTLFPYTTRFRSRGEHAGRERAGRAAAGRERPGRADVDGAGEGVGAAVEGVVVGVLDGDREDVRTAGTRPADRPAGAGLELEVIKRARLDGEGGA